MTPSQQRRIVEKLRTSYSVRQICQTLDFNRNLLYYPPKSDPSEAVAHRGRPWENGYAERLIRTLKEEEVYLNDYENIHEARVYCHRKFRPLSKPTKFWTIVTVA